ncbi:MAG TPA: efflux RND transporter permease subunit [Longimicrobiales bacterium]|nr:efflux RND transporter permease subunit [Longimicrobiales bacterium]
MKIVEFSVRNFQFTVVIFLMLVAIGLNSWFGIPRGEDPYFPVPGYSIIAVYPGATPVDVEQLVVDPIEERISELDELKEIKTRIEDGLAFIWVEFEAYADADKKKDEVQRELNALRDELPHDLYSLRLQEGGSDQVNIVQIALVSEVAPYHVLEQYAESLEDRLESVAGVRAASADGFPEHQVSVALDLQRLSELRLPLSQVLNAIGSEDANIPGGSVEIGGRKLNVKSSGNYASLDEVRGTVVGGAAGQLVRLGDVAEVSWGYADRTHIARFNGKRAVFVTARQNPEFNIAVVRDGIYRELDQFEPTLPKNIKLERGFDQSENVSRRLSRLGEDFLIAIGLVLLTLLPLGPRASAIVMISIPLSLAMGVALMYATGFSINQLSIVGAVIALGLLVDDSIVVVENISRFLREGYSRRDAAIRATKQIAVAVLGCTVTLVLAFLPLLFLPGLAGRYIRSLPIAVVYTVLASLVISVTIIPWLASLILKETRETHGNVFLRAFNRAIGATYAPLLHRALARPALTLTVAAALFAGSLALVPTIGFSLFPKAGTPQFTVDIETPAGSALDETDRAARFVEQVLGPRSDVRAMFSNVGRWNPQIYYNVIPRGERANVGQVFVQLKSYDPAHTPIMLDSLRARFAAYPGAKIQVKEFENGPPIDAPIAVRIVGDNLDTLRSLAAAVERAVAVTPGTQYVDNPLRLDRTDLKVEIDRAKAGLLGIPTVEIDRTLRLGIAGLDAGRLRDAEGEEYAVQVRLPHDGAPNAESLGRIYLASFTGAQVPLRQVADLRFAASPPVIQHVDKERAVTVTSYVRSGFNTDRVTRAVLERTDRIKRPAGYEFVAAGEIESRQESFGGIGTAVVVAVFSILAVLVLEFRTFKSTLIVASVIPLGLVGGLAALLLSGNTLSFTAMIGFVALIGIEIKTSILLVDFTNQLRTQGMALDDAIQRAGEVRFVPIVLTTLTAIGGLLPLALQGSALYSPLAWVIIGGLISSTLLARLVTPVMYKLLGPNIALSKGQ